MAENGLGELLIGALEEAAAHARGELSARVDRVPLTARRASVAAPPRYSPERIRSLRRELGVSQPVLAGMLNVSTGTVQAWEQGGRTPEGPSLRLLEVAERHPEVLLAGVAQKPGRAKAGG